MDIITEHEAKDKILKFLVDNREKGVPISSYRIWEQVYPDQKQQILYAVLKTLLYKDIVTSHIRSDEIRNFEVFFEATDLTEMFLNQGGFTKEFEEQQKERNEQVHIDQLNKRVLLAEVKIKEFEKSTGRKLIIWSFVLAVLSFLISVASILNGLRESASPSPSPKSFALPGDSLKQRIELFEKRLRTLEQSKNQDTTSTN
ncbi:MAG: hypothetical protein KA713_01055 [Chryseotalea sp. WA131a]|jgi:hypothetical protein|nr:MAG: hypothetical protein KA713_01055 [Chryseotalea sp. WA131a]